MLLNLAALVIDSQMTLPVGITIVREVLLALFAIYLIVHPYPHKNMLIKNGVHKSKKALQIFGIVLLALTIIGGIKLI